MVPRWSKIVAIVVLLVLVGALVGIAKHPDGTKWSDVIAAVGAIAIAASAIVTALMAHWTKRAAEAALDEVRAVRDQGRAVEIQATATMRQATEAARQAELSRLAVEASVLPWLTLGDNEPLSIGTALRQYEPPLTVGVDSENLSVTLAVRNVGAGLAVIDCAQSHLIGWPDLRAIDREPMPFTIASVANPVVPPQQQVRLRFAVDLPRWSTDFKTITNQQSGYGELMFDVVYGDGLGLVLTRARFHAGRDVYEDGSGTRERWHVFEASYFSPIESAQPRTRVIFG